uniref:Uncharacterized protein n=1 Tax=Hymenophyllum caudiculatum TaxID=295381 RepID=A0A2R4N4R7_9MONI|nr:hypothetical protein [Hymenophyllum caudiculatum]
MASLTLFSSSHSLALPLPTAHKCISSPRAFFLRPISTIASSSSNKSSSSHAPPPQLGLSRRLALPLLGLSLFLSSSPALAIDVPLFGIRKRVEQAEKAVVEEVKELVKEGGQLVKGGEKEVGAVAGAVTAFATSPVEPGGSLPPAYQAGAVAAAELVAVLVASSVVNGVVRES